MAPDDALADPGGDSVLTVVDLANPDVVHEFSTEGQRRSFGRGPDCDIVVRPASAQLRLSAVAGVIWRMDGELWLRNVSLAHDLYIELPGLPTEPPLPPRRNENDRGPARSVPADLAFVNGPDGCRLRVRQLWPENPLMAGSEYGGQAEVTVRVPRVPEELRDVAAALCAPLLDGGQLPASYAQIGVSTGIASRKSVRNKVEQLTALYLDEIPALRDMLSQRLEREAAQLGLPAAPHVVRGIRRFDAKAVELVDGAEQERRSALALPTYYEVAHLLVRRGLVGRPDQPAPVARAGPPTRPTGPTPAVVRIGRAETNTIVLPDLSVSREHAEVVVGAAGVELRDLGSGNGTLVNGSPVRRHLLVVGDVVTIGKYRLRFDGKSLTQLRQGR